MNFVLVLDCAGGETIAELAIHDSGGLLHRVDLSPEGKRLTTTDRNGFLEIWRLRPAPALEARVALPTGALTASMNLGSAFVLATEGGRIVKLELAGKATSAAADAPMRNFANHKRP